MSAAIAAAAITASQIFHQPKPAIYRNNKTYIYCGQDPARGKSGPVFIYKH